MLKKFLLFIFVLFSFISAEDYKSIPESDSTYSKFNIHAGAGLFNGLRLGFDYHFTKYLSITGDYGLPLFFLLGAGYRNINTSLNYQISEIPINILSTSVTRVDSRSFNDTRINYYIFQNFGRLFKLNNNNSIQIRAGMGVIFYYINSEFGEYAIRPNLDIIFNVNL